MKKVLLIVLFISFSCRLIAEENSLPLWKKVLTKAIEAEITKKFSERKEKVSEIKEKMKKGPSSDDNYYDEALLKCSDFKIKSIDISTDLIKSCRWESQVIWFKNYYFDGRTNVFITNISISLENITPGHDSNNVYNYTDFELEFVTSNGYFRVYPPMNLRSKRPAAHYNAREEYHRCDPLFDFMDGYWVY